MHDRGRLNIAKGLESLTLREKRVALGEIVRCTARQCRGAEITGADKLEAIRFDSDLAGHGAAARANAALARFLGRITATEADELKQLLRGLPRA
jgi:hypothetical protein